MSALTGTGRLIRLALRQDRLWLPVWLIALATLMFGSATTMLAEYPTAADRTAAAIATNSPGLRVLRGVATNASAGALTMAETLVVLSVFAALMTILTVVRHTRQEEEAGRSELIGAAPVGRLAGLAAAILVGVGANGILAMLLALALIAKGLPVTGSVAAGLGIGAVGLVFVGVAAVAAQLADTARGARGLAGAVLAIAYLLRGVGDALGELTAGGVNVDSAWPSWLSPLGWTQRLHPFDAEAWWVLGLHAGTVLITVLGAVALARRRDFGRGILPARRGPATASPHLLSPWGLAWRLQRATLLAWAIGVVVAGAVFGSLGQQVSEVVTDNARLAETLADLGSVGTDVIDVFYAAMLGVVGAIATGYLLQALLRLSTEEAEGRLEPLLATSVSRRAWLLSHLTWAVVGCVLLSLLLGLSLGLSDYLITHRDPTEIMRLTGAGLVPVAAMLVLGGLTVALVGLIPKRTAALSWGALAVALVLGPFGGLLGVPAWLARLSPFTHVPAAPAERIEVAPLLGLVAVALALMVVGLIAFRRRDVVG